MTRINLQRGKGNLTFHICIQCIIWTLAVCAMIFTFYKELTPIYTRESLLSTLPENTPELHPGESVSQSFQASYNYLHSVGVAIAYENNIPDNTSVLIQVLAGDDLIVEQTLSIWYCPNSSFCTLLTDLQNCQGKTITVCVENNSPKSEDAVFSLLATDKSFLYLNNTNNYTLNGEEQNARLLLDSSYLTGYSYYRALTYSFWIFLISLIISDLVSKRYFLRSVR